MAKRSNITEKKKHAVFASDNYTCRACGYYDEYGMGLTVDHIHPVSAGGTNNMANLQCLCQTCNAMKGAIVTPELPVRKPTVLHLTHKQAMAEIFANREAFYKTLYKQNKGWFQRRDKTLELVQRAKAKEKLPQSMRDRLSYALKDSFNKRKRVLDFAPFLEEYERLVKAATPATIACSLAY